MKRFFSALPKKSWRLHFYGVILILAAFFGMWTRSFRPVLAQQEFDGQGFWWSDSFGWISLNCRNDWQGNGAPLEDRCAPGQYGVDFRWQGLTGTLSGTAWSPNLGLICFDSVSPGCAGLKDPVTGGSLEVSYSFREGDTVFLEEEGKIVEVAPVRGFARIVGFESAENSAQGGWLQFEGRERGRTLQDRGNGGAGVRISLASTDERGRRLFDLILAGSAWQQNEAGGGAGWIYLGEPPPGNPTQENPGASQSTDPIPPGIEPPETEKETACPDGDALYCCLNRKDDDWDESYTGRPDRQGATGVDCQDYDCSGLSFYSETTYNSDAANAYEHCGPIPTIQGRPANRENALISNDCFDDIDNDLDYLKDCGDPDCGEAEHSDGLRTCKAEFVARERDFCLDGLDNDGDGAADCADEECRARGELCQGDNFLTGHAQCAAGALSGSCAAQCPAGAHDHDHDLVCSTIDNCPEAGNDNQVDSNGNGRGDACDAFLETKEGSIYAPRLRVAPPPPGRATATYCILTAGAQRFVEFNARSHRCEIPREVRDVAASELRLLQYPDSVALLSAMAGETLRSRIDTHGLKRERYGTVTRIPSELTSQEAGRALASALERGDGQVIYRVGDVTLESAVKIPARRGAVTILVEGNLVFGPGARVVYEPGVSGAVQKIPSVAWIALDPHPYDELLTGSIRIDHRVTELVGALFAADTISTGSGNLQLRIHGLMVARRFRFEREYLPELTTAPEIPQGAEVVIYDGRLALNPPPGLTDLVKTLPVLRTVPR